MFENMEDFELVPFYEKGGDIKFYNIFGKESGVLLEKLNERLAA